MVYTYQYVCTCMYVHQVKKKKLKIKKFENVLYPVPVTKNPREFLCHPVMESYGFMVIVLVAFAVVGFRIGLLSSCMTIDY